VRELADFDREVWTNQWILVHAIVRVAARVAHDSRAVQQVVEAVMRTTVYPQAGRDFRRADVLRQKRSRRSGASRQSAGGCSLAMAHDG
jgi:hypothetical protein